MKLSDNNGYLKPKNKYAYFESALASRQWCILDTNSGCEGGSRSLSGQPSQPAGVTCSEHACDVLRLRETARGAREGGGGRGRRRRKKRE